MAFRIVLYSVELQSVRFIGHSKGMGTWPPLAIIAESSSRITGRPIRRCETSECTDMENENRRNPSNSCLTRLAP